MTLPAKPLSNTSKLLFLDGLRGLAALYVMVGHARWLLWEGFEDYSKHPETYTSLNRAMVYGFSLFRYGHEVVLFFFVLSGFVIHLKYANAYAINQQKEFDYRTYMWKRFKRIYPPFIVAIILTAVLDYVGRRMGLSIYEGQTNNELVNSSVGKPDSGLSTLAGNVVFLYENYFPLFGTNGPAWSLKYEWWFYILFPAFLSFGKKNILYPTIAITVLFALSFFPTYWPERLLPDIFSMMLTWWLGVILAEIYAGRIKVNLRLMGWAMSALLIFLLPIEFSSVWNDLVMAIFFFGLLALLLSSGNDNRIRSALGNFKFFGDFSYTLYIIHFPILIFFAGLVIRENNNMQPVHFGYVFAGIMLTILVSYFLHFVTELPFVGSKNRSARTLIKVASVNQKVNNANRVDAD